MGARDKVFKINTPGAPYLINSIIMFDDSGMEFLVIGEETKLLPTYMTIYILYPYKRTDRRWWFEIKLFIYKLRLRFNW